MAGTVPLIGGGVGGQVGRKVVTLAKTTEVSAISLFQVPSWKTHYYSIYLSLILVGSTKGLHV